MNKFPHMVEQFADLRILRYNIPNFEHLPLNQKLYIYYLSEAALCGRDIIWDQNNKYNLWVRQCLTFIYHGLEKNDIPDSFIEYYKRVLFSNGIHHHYSTDKIKPQFSKESLVEWALNISTNQVEALNCTTHKAVIEKIVALLFNEEHMSKRVCQDEGKDLVLHSANNFYDGMTQEEAEQYYQQHIDKDDQTPISYGLNSRLIKTNGKIKEQVWKTDGTYGKVISQIVYWLQKAGDVAENEQQKKVIDLLCNFYRTGDLKLFDEYSIEWLKEQQGEIDFINGFIEVYGDPLGFKATWESLVNITDKEETAKAAVISENAQWFEDHSPVADKHRKEKVSGVSMKVINAIILGGDCYPTSPLGINLPNAEWIREVHGSKSVSLQNISHAYEMASLSSGVIEEFAYSEEEVALHKQFGAVADHLHTHLHECVGHGSGKLEDGVRSDDLKAYGSVIEEARADLFGLYFIADEKMLELNLVDSMQVAKAQYNSYIRNGLMVQLARISQGANIEQAHMRNRQLVCKWVFEKGAEDNVIIQKSEKGKSYFVIQDYQKLRLLFGQLLNEVQRIKSQGDYQAAKKLVENYGVNVDQTIHTEVIERYTKLGVAPYSGFINPFLKPICDESGKIIDVEVNYTESFLEQMIRYGEQYGYLSS